MMLLPDCYLLINFGLQRIIIESITKRREKNHIVISGQVDFKNRYSNCLIFVLKFSTNVF